MELTEEEKLANIAAGLNEDGTPKTEEQDPPKEKTAAEKAEEAMAAERARHKEKLDAAYAARDKAEKEKNELLRAARDRELADLEKEGKHAEAAQARADDAEKRAAAAEARVVALERDQVVSNALAEVNFRNARARSVAVAEITSELIQAEDGSWAHKSGASIAAFVKAFVDDEENDYLLKPRQNSGGGQGKLKDKKDIPAPKKGVLEMSTEELIAHYSKKT